MANKNSVSPTLKSVFGDSALNTTVMYGGKIYPVFKNGSNYYIIQYSNGAPIKQSIIGKESAFKKNNNVCVDINKSNLGLKSNTGLSSSNSTTKTETKTEASNSNQVTQSYGGGGGYYAPPSSNSSYYDKTIADLTQRIYELEHPKVYTAQELADIYGIDYNEQNILNDYNKSTNEYYDAAVKAQNDLRTQYAKNNAKYVDQVADSYINSYANAAPTAVGKGSLAANALSTQLNASQLNASNDYGMMQSVNNLEEARKAELKENPNLAKQYYNNIGTYLSGLSAELNKSDVKQYVDKLDAYSQMYAADRSYQSYLAQANAAKYAGLANAAATNAATSASRANSFDKLWNYFYTAHGNDSNYASNAVANLLKTSTNTAGK